MPALFSVAILAILLGFAGGIVLPSIPQDISAKIPQPAAITASLEPSSPLAAVGDPIPTSSVPTISGGASSGVATPPPLVPATPPVATPAQAPTTTTTSDSARVARLESLVSSLRRDFTSLESRGLSVESSVNRIALERATPVFQTVSGADLELRLQQLSNKLSADITRVQNSSNQASAGNFAAIALTNKIDKLEDVTLTNPVLSGTISGLTADSVPVDIQLNTASSTIGLLTASSGNIGNLIFTNATGTSATTTNFFSTTASSTNLFAQNASFGNVSVGSLATTSVTNLSVTNTSTSTFAGGLSVAGLGSFANLLASGSTTLQDFTGLKSTTTYATSTALAVTGATTLNTLLVTGSTTFQNVTVLNSTTTNATSTNSTSTNLAVTGNTYVNILFASGLSSLSNLLTSGSTTLQSFTGLNSTTTNATSTTLSVSGNTQLTTLQTSGLSTLANLFLTGSTTLQDFTGLNSTTTNATSTTLAVSGNTQLVTLQTSGLGTFANLLATGSTTLQNFTGLNSTTTNASTTNFYVSGVATFADIVVTGSSTIQNFSVVNSTTTNATTTNATSTTFFATTASSTNLFAQTASIGTLVVNSLANLLVTGSSTLQNFTAINSTTTSATTTNFAVLGTGTTTIAGFLDVNGTDPSNATSTFASNLWVKGSLKVGLNSLFFNDNTITSDTGVFSLTTSTSTTATTSFSSNLTVGRALTAATSTLGNTTVSTLALTSSTTLQDFTAQSATTTSATTTNLAVIGTGTTTLAGFLDVLGTGTNSTSTFESNLWVKGTLRSSVSFNGDLFFANGFSFTESDLASTTQQLLLKNQFGTTTLIADDKGNFAIGTSTEDIYRLKVGGDVAATGFVNVSTGSSKTDIVHLTENQEASILDKIEDIKVATYHYKSEDQSNPLRLGLIAEEAPKEVLSTDGKGVDIYKLTTFALAGIKAQQKEIDEMKLQIADLQSKIGLPSTNSGQLTLQGVLDMLKGAALRVKSLTTDTLCVGETCVTETELKSLLEKNSITPVPNTTSSLSTPATTPDTSTTTPTGDTEAPVITLNGANPATIPVGSTYIDLGAVITDNVSTNMNLVVTGDQIDTSTPGTHEVKYNATDGAGNQALEVTRTVTVTAEDPTPQPPPEPAPETATTTTP